MYPEIDRISPLLDRRFSKPRLPCRGFLFDGRASSWRDFLLGPKARGLHGVEFVVADDHAGLRAALREVLAEAAYQRCYVHFLRNALDHVPRKSLPSRKRG